MSTKFNKGDRIVDKHDKHLTVVDPTPDLDGYIACHTSRGGWWVVEECSSTLVPQYTEAWANVYAISGGGGWHHTRESAATAAGAASGQFLAVIHRATDGTITVVEDGER